MILDSNSLAIKFKSPNDEDESDADEFEKNDVNVNEKILTHSKFNYSINKKKSIESEYLKSRKWKYIYEDEEPYIEINYENIKKNLKDEDIKLLFDNISKSNLTDALNNCEIDDDIYPIGVLHSLEYLIEKRYFFSLINQDNMISDMSKLKQIIFKYRTLKKDGNSFYRGVIFNFLENVIFSKNILLMKEILILFNEKISEKNIIIKGKKDIIDIIKKIEKDTIINILYIIIQQMEIQRKEKYIELSPYIVLLKVFLFCPEFDEGIIFFTRYLIYEYIKYNEYKFLSENKKVKILDLIPTIYKDSKNGINEFYKDLITNGCEAYNDMIYSYIVPFVYNCSLNVLVYKLNSDDSIIKQMEYINEKHTEYEINLLLEKDFDIFYKNYFYDKNINEMDNFICSKENEDLSIFKQESIKNSNYSIKNKSRRISSQYPNKLDIKNLHLSISIKSGIQQQLQKETKKYKLKCSDSNSNSLENSNAENKYINTIKDSNNFGRFLLKKNTMKEKILSESSIIKMIKKGSKCHNKDCPNMIIEENILNLCDTCKIIEIKNYILQTYLFYLQLDINKNSAIRLKQYFSKSKIKITEEQEMPLMQLIKELKLNFEELFTQVRIGLCLWCWKNIEGDNYFIKLPCDCKLCSKQCFDKYISLVEEKNDKVILKENENEEEIVIMPMKECPCGYEYKLKDFIYMLKILKSKKLNSYIDTYENLIKNNWKWMCVFCRKNYSKKIKFIRIFFKDQNLEYSIINKIEFKHSICEKCSLDKKIKIGGNMKIFCNFCESEHYIEQIKDVGENNKTDSECIII